MKERLFDLLGDAGDLWWHIEDIRRVMEMQIEYICERNLNSENEDIISVLQTQLRLLRLVEAESSELQERIDRLWRDCN